MSEISVSRIGYAVRFFFFRRKAVKGAIVLLPLLGVTNVIRMLSAPVGRVWEFALWSYSTHFLATFQGMFVALWYCLLNKEVKKHWLAHKMAVLPYLHPPSYLFPLYTAFLTLVSRLRNGPFQFRVVLATPILHGLLTRTQNDSSEWWRDLDFIESILTPVSKKCRCLPTVGPGSN